MAIYLITGTPGHGKSLFTVSLIVEKLSKTGRPIYADIDGFDHGKAGTFPFHYEDPSSPGRSISGRHWQEVPDGSILILDECQHSFPVRNPASKVPDYIAAFETHRHRGIDLYLITQAPRYIDRHIWPLVETHHHFHRMFGLPISNHYTWGGINESPDPANNAENANKQKFRFPRKYYGYYKSAVVHTNKARLPVGKLATLVISLIVASVCGWLVFQRMSHFGGASAASGSSAGDSDRRQTTEHSSLAGNPEADTPCARVVGAFGDNLFYALPDRQGLQAAAWVSPGEHISGLAGVRRCNN